MSLRKISHSKKEDMSVRGLVNKFEKSPRSMTKTFTTINENDRTIRKKIENFKQLSMEGEKCLIGSGRCARHNTRVVGLVEERNVSVVKKNGSIGWKMFDVLILACPSHSLSKESGTSTVSGQDLSDREGVIANKRARVITISEESQSDLSTVNQYENNPKAVWITFDFPIPIFLGIVKMTG